MYLAGEKSVDNTEKILNILQISATERISPRQRITYYKFIEAMLKHHELLMAMQELALTKDQLYKYLSRYIYKRIPNKPLKVNWQNYLLQLISLKRCSKCHKIYNVSNFVKNSDTWDNLQGTCRDCKAEHRKHFTENNPQYASEHYINNQAQYKENAARYRVCKEQATPIWANREQILRIYKDCPIGFNVDHIYPLQSSWVCGLHVESNLQYLQQEENLKKGNRFCEKYHI